MKVVSRDILEGSFDMSRPKISILLPAYKSEKLLTEVFLLGMLNNTESIELIIYDNGGNGFCDIDGDNPPLYWQRIRNMHSDVKIIGDGKNIGLNTALNECAKVATGEWYYLPHTDMYLMPNWDLCLLETVKNCPPASLLLCSRSIEPTKGHTDFHIIKDYGKEPHEFNREQLLEDFRGYSNSTIVFGARMPFFLHESLWAKMDGVDSNLFSYCTDDDLIQTAYDVGVRKLWVVYDSLVYHLVGKSNLQQSVDRDSQQPYIYFVEKWRKKGYLDAHHPGQWHPKMFPFGLKIK